MIGHGTTLVEIKSGYGLNFESELKMLRVIECGNNIHPITIVSTYCGAHSVNKKETNVNEYRKDILFNQIPKLIEYKNKGYINPIMIDVFHEKGIFEYKDTYDILKQGVKYGMGINFHGDELHYNKSGELAAVELVKDIVSSFTLNLCFFSIAIFFFLILLFFFLFVSLYLLLCKYLSFLSVIFIFVLLYFFIKAHELVVQCSSLFCLLFS